MMALAFGLILKGILKVLFRLKINQFSNEAYCSFRQLAMAYKMDETHLVLYSWEIRYLVYYQFCELQGLKGGKN